MHLYNPEHGCAGSDLRKSSDTQLATEAVRGPAHPELSSLTRTATGGHPTSVLTKLCISKAGRITGRLGRCPATKPYRHRQKDHSGRDAS